MGSGRGMGTPVLGSVEVDVWEVGEIREPPVPGRMGGGFVGSG